MPGGDFVAKCTNSCMIVKIDRMGTEMLNRIIALMLDLIAIARFGSPTLRDAA